MLDFNSYLLKSNLSNIIILIDQSMHAYYEYVWAVCIACCPYIHTQVPILVAKATELNLATKVEL
jgi:hypothetical protein